MRKDLVGWAGPAVALFALAFAGCGARSDLSYGDEVGAAASPSFSGSMPGAGDGGASGFGASGGARGGTAAVSGSGGVPMPQASGCDATGVYQGEVFAAEVEDLRVLEGCVTVRGNLQLIELYELSTLRSLRNVEGQLRLSNYKSAPTGLEQLESVQVLELDTVANFALAALGNLTSMHTLSVTRSRLVDFSGLGPSRNLRRVTIENSDVASLQGLALPLRLEQVNIVESTLRDLSALTVVEEIGALQINNVSGLTSLKGLENFARAETVDLRSNPDLTDISALHGLVEALALAIVLNPALERVDSLRGLESLGRLAVLGNERLLEVPHLQGLASAASIHIEENASLLEVLLPTLEQLQKRDAAVGFGQGELQINGNPSLERISLPRLASADTIRILKNGALTTLELGALVSARDALFVVLNQQLPPSSLGSLANVATEHRKIAGNQGEPTALNPCTWPADQMCDEYLGICAPGTDAQDCGIF